MDGADRFMGAMVVLILLLLLVGAIIALVGV
jgi:hypothetical protein